MANSNPLARRHGYPFVTGMPVLVPLSGSQLNLQSVACVNGSASLVSNIGIGYTLGSGLSGVFVASGGAATPYVPGAFLANAGDQLYFQSQNKMADFIAFVNSTPGTGSPVFTYEYWNGTAWTALTPQAAPDFTKATTGLIIGPPLDWAPGANSIVGLDPLRYTSRITVTTAPTGAAQSQIFVCALLLYRENVESKQALEVNFDQSLVLNAQQSIMPYFSVVDIHNSVELGYKRNQ